jgi:hypothetical protein
VFVRGVRAGERVRFGGSEVSAFVLFLFSVSFLSLSLCVRRRVLCQTRVSEMGVVILCVFASSAAPFERDEMMMMLMLKNLLLFITLYLHFSLSLSLMMMMKRQQETSRARVRVLTFGNVRARDISGRRIRSSLEHG